jgi:tetratricopeptide (TPR) repeat protein
VIGVAALSVFSSNLRLLAEEQQLRNSCSVDRNIAGCTRIVQDQSTGNAVRAAAYLNRGLGYHGKNDYDRAIADYIEAIKIDSNDATAYYNRGLAYHAKGDTERAIADYSAAIKLDPKYESALEADFRALDAVAYDKLIAQQRHRREELRSEEVAKLLNQIKETSPKNLDQLRDIYSRLMSLDDNPAYKAKKDALSAQIAEASRKAEITRLLDELKTIPPTELSRIYTLYEELTVLDPKNEEFKKKREAINKQLQAMVKEQKAEKTKKATDEKQWTKEVLLISVLRTKMQNPASFQLERALRMKDGILCITYRGTNSFNATVPGRAVIDTKTTGASTGEEAWSKYCAGKTGEDISSIRHAIFDVSGLVR